MPKKTHQQLRKERQDRLIFLSERYHEIAAELSELDLVKNLYTVLRLKATLSDIVAEADGINYHLGADRIIDWINAKRDWERRR